MREATATTEVVTVTEEVQAIELGRIMESPTNPRQIFRGLEELADSIREHGIIEPLVARRRETIGGLVEFELVCGARRYRAAELAGLERVPVIVRELDDLAVIAQQVIENGQREDVHPLEEAEGYQRLLEELQKAGIRGAVDSVAARVGKGSRSVYDSLKLLSLTLAAREAFLRDEFSTSVAILIARVPGKVLQEKLLGQIQSLGEEASVRQVKAIIKEEYVKNLNGAPFLLGDAELVPEAGPCMVCPKKEGADVCTDPPCYKSKVEAAWGKKVAAAEKSGQRVLTEEESKRIFNYNSPRLFYSTGFVDLDGPCEEDAENRPWRELLGKKEAAKLTVIARDNAGGIRELLEEGKALELVRKSGAVAPPPRALGMPDDAEVKRREKEMAQQQREREARITVADAIKAQVIEKARRAKSPPIDLLVRIFLLRELEFGDSDSFLSLLEKRGTIKPDAEWENDDGLRALTATTIEGLEGAELVQFGVEFVIGEATGFSHTGALKEGLDAACRYFKIDVEAMVQEALAPKKKEPAAKKPSKKKTAAAAKKPVKKKPAKKAKAS